MRPPNPSSGFTLMELLVVITLAGLLLTLAAPSLSGFTARTRTAGALNTYTADVYAARMLALRSTRRVVLQLDSPGHCSPRGRAKHASSGYRIILKGEVEQEIKRVSLLEYGRKICLSTNRQRELHFDSRGLISPPGNRTVWAEYGTTRDSLSISVAGRVFRRF